MSCEEKYQIGWAENTPHTFKGALPTDFDDVINCRVIHIVNGFYRGSIINGTFEIYVKDKEKDFLIFTHKGDRVRVVSYWFCRRPYTTFPQILIQKAEIRVVENFTGKVIRNIGCLKLLGEKKSPANK